MNKMSFAHLCGLAALALVAAAVLAPPATAIPCEARCDGPSSLSCGCYDPEFAIITCSQYWYSGCPGRTAGPVLDIEASRTADFAAQNLAAWTELTAAAAKAPSETSAEAPEALRVELPAAVEER